MKVVAKVTKVPIAKILLDDGTQTRAKIDQEAIDRYAKDAKELPPVVLFTIDGKTYWPGSGHHRVPAWRKAGWKEVPAEVRKGGKRDAVLFGVTSDSIHGLTRSNEDKRTASRILLQDEEWGQCTDRAIAEKLKISHHTVAEVRAEMEAEKSGEGSEKSNGQTPTRRIGQGGRTYPAKSKLCEKCRRVGAVAGCPQCEALQKEKSDVKAGEAAAKAKRIADRAAAKAKKAADAELAKSKRLAARAEKKRLAEEAAGVKKAEREAALAKREADKEAERQARAEKKRKPGAVQYDWRQFHKCFGLVARAPDDIGKAYPGEKDGTEFAAAIRCMETLAKIFKGWERKLAKVKGDD